MDAGFVDLQLIQPDQVPEAQAQLLTRQTASDTR